MTNPQDNFLSADTNFDTRINRLNEIISKCNKIVFLGGAGVSTASGIPDFRSANGLYNNKSPEYAKYQPEYLLSTQCFNHNPKVFYKFYREFMDLRNFEPNILHKKLALLEQQGKLSAIVTQNIDMLHEKAGSKNVYKIHGTINSNHCIKCGKKFDIDYIFENKDAIPRCDCNKSNNYVKPDVVLYGDKLPQDAFTKGVQAIENADCLIICGTSLLVQPAASLPNYFQGEYMIILNKMPTNLDAYADVVCHEDMFEVFEKIDI